MMTMIGIGINIGLPVRGRAQSGRQHQLYSPQRQRPLELRMRSRGEDFWTSSWQTIRGAAAKIEEGDLSVANGHIGFPIC